MTWLGRIQEDSLKLREGKGREGEGREGKGTEWLGRIQEVSELLTWLYTVLGKGEGEESSVDIATCGESIPTRPKWVDKESLQRPIPLCVVLQKHNTG